MAVTTTETLISKDNGGTILERHVETGSDNTALTASTPSDTAARRFLYATIKYDDAPTYSASVTATLNSGAGAGYDSVLAESTDNDDQDVVLTPAVETWIRPGDVIDVLAPAGGSGIAAAVAIYTIKQGALSS